MRWLTEVAVRVRAPPLFLPCSGDAGVRGQRARGVCRVYLASLGPDTAWAPLFRDGSSSPSIYSAFSPAWDACKPIHGHFIHLLGWLKSVLPLLFASNSFLLVYIPQSTIFGCGYVWCSNYIYIVLYIIVFMHVTWLIKLHFYPWYLHVFHDLI